MITLTDDQVHRLPVQPQLGRQLHLCVLAIQEEADGVCGDVVVCGVVQLVRPVLLHPLVGHVKHASGWADLCVLYVYRGGGVCTHSVATTNTTGQNSVCVRGRGGVRL